VYSKEYTFPTSVRSINMADARSCEVEATVVSADTVQVPEMVIGNRESVKKA